MTDKQNFEKDINVPSKEQMIIDTNKYFVELIDKGGGTVGYTVVFPERLLIEIIKQNKQLTRKTQECEQLQEKYEALKLENQEGYEIVVELKHECEELKEQLRRTRHIALNQTNNVNFYEKDNDRYRKALEEVEEYVRDNSDFDKSDILTSKTGAYDILNIINKAK